MEKKLHKKIDDKYSSISKPLYEIKHDVKEGLKNIRYNLDTISNDCSYLMISLKDKVEKR